MYFFRVDSLTSLPAFSMPAMRPRKAVRDLALPRIRNSRNQIPKFPLLFSEVPDTMPSLNANTLFRRLIEPRIEEAMTDPRGCFSRVGIEPVGRRGEDGPSASRFQQLCAFLLLQRSLYLPQQLVYFGGEEGKKLGFAQRSLHDISRQESGHLRRKGIPFNEL